MSINNPVGNIPIKTPLLNKMLNASNAVYETMSDDEVLELDKEIKSLTNSNCRAEIKEFAEIYANRVDAYVRRYIKGEWLDSV